MVDGAAWSTDATAEVAARQRREPGAGGAGGRSGVAKPGVPACAAWFLVHRT